MSDRVDKFTITEDHIKLLRQAYVRWESCEYGAPAIDCKRPYGNSSVEYDMREILGREQPDKYTSDDEEELYLLHKQTLTALQIFLYTGKMEAGDYEAPTYTQKWSKV